MGLYVGFDIVDLGLPVYAQALVGGIIPVFVSIDYTPAFKAFVATFLDEATNLVPVDTGYLQSTINADFDSFSCYAEATADYAEYVEYGTSYMDAQPYFEPALEKAMEVFWEIVEDAKSEAQEKIIEEIEPILEDMLAAAEDVFLIMMLGLILAMLAAIVQKLFDTVFRGNGKSPEVLII